MRIAADLHIHTALSPCGSEDMTPHNIVNMALLKGLDAIGITDHNACDNVPAVLDAAAGRLLVVPGMELQTREDIHLLCYFPSMDAASRFDQSIRPMLEKRSNRPEIFGHQRIFGPMDSIIGEREALLAASLEYTLEEATDAVLSFGGVPVPAHINRPSFSILSQLGFLPEDLPVRTVEYVSNLPLDRVLLNRYTLITASDAHDLGDILERQVFWEVPEHTVSGILRYLSASYP